MQQKSNIFLTTKERLLLYLEYKGITQYQFSKDTGLSNGFLKSGSSVSSDNLKLLSNIYSDINLLWVITGDGEMILEKNGNPNGNLNNQSEEKPEPIIIYQRDPRDIEIIELQRNHIKLLNEKMSGDFFDGGAGSGDFAPAAPDAHTTSRHPAQFNDPTRHRN